MGILEKKLTTLQRQCTNYPAQTRFHVHVHGQNIGESDNSLFHRPGRVKSVLHTDNRIIVNFGHFRQRRDGLIHDKIPLHCDY